MSAFEEDRASGFADARVGGEQREFDDVGGIAGE
jgi:hypothetical protein